jgi:hypothetical protein
MRYLVDIIRLESPGPSSEAGQPTYRLPGEFGGLDEANAAAQQHIKELGLPPGEVHYRVVDQDGREVVTTHEPQA